MSIAKNFQAFRQGINLDAQANHIAINIMVTKFKKIIEKFYAEKASKLLNESWEVEPSPDETNWPDLLVTTRSERFGLEVREFFPDESGKGSTKKANEQNNLKNVKKLADAYYKNNSFSIKVDLLGDIGQHEQLLSAITRVVPQLSEFEQERIEVCDGCIIYVRRLPDQLGQYKRWSYITDKVGWVSNIDKDLIDRVINEKANKLSKYTTHISDVRLLIISNRIFNSGKSHLKKNVTCDARGFKKVYYLSYPQEVWQIA